MKELNIFQIILDSGIVVQLNLLLLIVFSIATWSIVYYYYNYFKKINIADEEFLKVFESFTPDDLAGLEKLFKETDHIQDSTLNHVYKNVFQDLIKLNTIIKKNGGEGIKDYFFQNRDYDYINNSIHKSIGAMTVKLSKYKTYLASIATIAPFVGLFGTVWGIIDAFAALGLGGGNISSIAPGIAEALVATAVGLFAAIPASWFFNFYTQKINLKKEGIHSFSFDLINFLHKSLLKY